jgi:hypothetical protein
MLLAIIVGIELFIEGRRELMFEKITQGNVAPNSNPSTTMGLSSSVGLGNPGSSNSSNILPQAFSSSVADGNDNPFIYTVNGSL